MPLTPGDDNTALVGASEQALVEILNIATTLSGASDLRTLLQLILSKSRQLTCSDAGSIFLVERCDLNRNPGGTDQLRFAVSQNASLTAASSACGVDQDIDSTVSEIHFPLTSERLLGWSALSGEVPNIPDVYQLDPPWLYRFDSWVNQNLGYRAVSMSSAMSGDSENRRTKRGCRLMARFCVRGAGSGFLRKPCLNQNLHDRTRSDSVVRM